jgi:hypothetical protein
VSQATYTQTPAAGRPGQRADYTTFDAHTVYTGAPLEPGRLYVRDGGASPNYDRSPTAIAPAALAADPDAIIATGASADAEQVLDAADFDGDLGDDYLPVPAFVDLVLSNSTDWDATNATLTGIGADGAALSVTLAIPDGGNATVSTTVSFWRVTGLTIPAQTADGGTFTLGVSASGRELTAAQILGPLILDPGVADGPIVPAERDAACARRGAIFVEAEETVNAGAPAYVRTIAGEGEALGALRDDVDGGDCVLVPGVYFERAISATVAVLRIKGDY